MACPPEIDEAVLTLLRDKITSFEQLEIVLLLRGRREEALSAVAIAQLLRVSDSAAEEALDHLYRHDFLSIRREADQPGFVYSPASASLGDAVDQLAVSYEQNTLAVIKQMSSNSLERVRTEAIRTFADAFLIGTGKKRDG